MVAHGQRFVHVAALSIRIEAGLTTISQAGWIDRATSLTAALRPWQPHSFQEVDK
jgi:hypothetical protein